MSEQLSDKSSSPALPDDLSLDEHASDQMLIGGNQVHTRARTHARAVVSIFTFFPLLQGGSSGDFHSSGDLPTEGQYEGLPRSAASRGEENEEALRQLFEASVRPGSRPPSAEPQSPTRCAGTNGTCNLSVTRTLDL